MKFRREWIPIAIALAGLQSGAPREACGAGSMGPVEIRGLLDVCASTRGEGLEANWFNAGASMFDAYRLRLFFDGAATPQISVHTQLVLDEINTHPVYGAYATMTPWIERDAHILAGKIPWVIGTYGPRTYSDKKPLVGTPLMHQYHTTLRGDAIPANADELLAVRGRGQYGVTYGGASRTYRGMPVLYDFCWDFGVAVQGSAAPVEYSLALMNGTPSMMMAAQDWNEGRSIMGRLGVQPSPLVRAGVSASYGPYLSSALNPVLPAGKTANDYAQRLYMADLSLETGHFEVRGEAFLNRWATPTLGDLDVSGGYVEGKVGLINGAYAAGRWETMRFSDLTGSSGEAEPWNYDIDRIETGLGYRIARGTVVKAIYQTNRTHDDGEIHTDDLWALQMGVSF